MFGDRHLGIDPLLSFQKLEQSTPVVLGKIYSAFVSDVAVSVQFGVKLKFAVAIKRVAIFPGVVVAMSSRELLRPLVRREQ